MADPREMRIAYILDWFPSLSETFVLREILALERRGVHIELFAMRRQLSGPVHEEARALAQRTHYRPPLWSAKLWAHQAHVLARCSRPYLQQMAWALRHARNGPRELVTAIRTVLTAADLMPQLRERGIRHVHAHFARRPTTTAMFVSRLGDVSFSFTGHACDIFTGEADLLPEKLKAARFAVTCTHTGRDALLEHDPTGELAEKVHMVHHGLDLSEWDVPRRPTEPPTILSVGRLVPKKGFDVLLRACRILLDKGLPFACEILGYGPLREDLLGQVAMLGLTDCVTLRGPVLQDAVRESLSRATVFTLASRATADGHCDGLPNVVLEALAARVPVVATRAGAIPEAIDTGHTGLLVPSDDPQALAEGLEQVLGDPGLRERLAEAGRQRVERDFDADANVLPIVQLFEEAIGA